MTRTALPMIRSTNWLDGALRDCGFADLRDAARWAEATDRTSSELAKHLGVNWRRLNSELRANGFRLTPLGSRMLAAARDHVASDRSLADCPPDMRRWFQTLLRPRYGSASGETYGEILDALDPTWRTV